MTQFSHQSWGPADGIDRVYSIAQTKDGYLWLGTGRGLMRFDGVQFTRLEATEGQLAPMGATIGLLARRDGSLWSSSGAGYLQMRDGRTDFLPHLDGGTIGGKLLESSDGTIWAAAKGVLKFTNGYFERMYPDGVAKKESRDRFMAIVEDHSGTLWASEIRQPGDDRTSLVFLPTDGTNFILPHQFLGLAGDLKVAPDGTIWAAEVMVDLQPQMLFGVGNFDRQNVINFNVALGKAARIFDIPVVLSTVETKSFSGNIWPQIKTLFPDKTTIERSTMNSWDDKNFVAAVEKTGRKKIVLTGLWTETCVALLTVQALYDGYEVYVVEDCCGDVSQLSHDNAMKRVIQAGAKPVTALSVMLEWQRDWAAKDTYDAVMDVVKTHFGAYGMGVEYAYTMVHGAPPTKLPEYVVPAAANH
jgi:nicotinamidase-related amidase